MRPRSGLLARTDGWKACPRRSRLSDLARVRHCHGDNAATTRSTTMTTALSIAGKIKITASIEHRTSQYGAPRPTMVLQLVGDAAYKLALVAAHQVAAE